MCKTITSYIHVQLVILISKGILHVYDYFSTLITTRNPHVYVQSAMLIFMCFLLYMLGTFFVLTPVPPGAVFHARRF